jgi:glycosyltransferase involved in cell wall biosynthesis
MKLLYLANIRLPSERAHAAQIVNMCNGFEQAGVEVQLVIADRKTGITESVDAYYGQRQLFALHKIKTLEFISLGALFFHLSSLVFALKALHIFKKNKIDIVYSREELLLYVLSLFISPKQLVWESHQAKYNFFVRSLLKRDVKLVVISEGIRDYYVKQGVPIHKILIAHDGVDSSFFGEQQTKDQSRADLELPLSAKIAMYIGGFESWKGAETFFETSNKVNDVLFVAIGGKDEEIEHFKQKFPKVVFLGRKPYRELNLHQQAADVLVIPNTARVAISSQYTSPLKLFAHMTSKVPMVVSDIPSIKNVVNDQQAFFFEADNSTSLGEVVEMVANNSLSSSLKANQAFELSKKFTWHARAETIKVFIS